MFRSERTTSLKRVVLAIIVGSTVFSILYSAASLFPQLLNPLDPTGAFDDPMDGTNRSIQFLIAAVVGPILVAPVLTLIAGPVWLLTHIMKRHTAMLAVVEGSILALAGYVILVWRYWPALASDASTPSLSVWLSGMTTCFAGALSAFATWFVAYSGNDVKDTIASSFD